MISRLEQILLYEQSALTPETVLSGMVKEDKRKADVDSVMLEIKAAFAEEQRRQERAKQRAATRPLRREIERLEVEMQALTEDIAAIDARLADNSVYEGAKEVLNQLITEQGQLRTRLGSIESAWLNRQEQLEEAMELAKK